MCPLRRETSINFARRVLGNCCFFFLYVDLKPGKRDGLRNHDRGDPFHHERSFLLYSFEVHVSYLGVKLNVVLQH